MEEKMIECLFKGMTQIEISDYFKKENIVPNSLSSIEKKLKDIRLKHGANTMFHLSSILSKNKF